MKKTVFIIDDDAAVRDSLKEVLALSGFETRTFASGHEALAVVESARRGCLLLDIRLPDIDGFAVLDKLRSRRSELPVILMTGHDDLAREAEASGAEAFALLEKPVNDDVLLETLERAFLQSPCGAAEEPTARHWAGANEPGQSPRANA